MPEDIGFDGNKEGPQTAADAAAAWLKDPKAYRAGEAKRGAEEADRIVRKSSQKAISASAPTSETKESTVLPVAHELKTELTQILQELPAYKTALMECAYKPELHLPEDEAIRFTSGEHRYAVRFIEIEDDINALQIRRRRKVGSLETPIEEARAEMENSNYWDEDCLISDAPQNPDIIYTISRAYRHKLIKENPAIAIRPRTTFSTQKSITSVRAIQNDLRTSAPTIRA